MEPYTDSDSNGKWKDKRKAVWACPNTINTSKRGTAKRNETDWGGVS